MERELEAPASLSLCLAILILRTALLTQDEVISHLRCGKPTIVKVEGWFKELPFSQAEALCCDASLTEEARGLIAKSEEELLIPTAIKVGAISSNTILRHYRSDYLKQKDKKIPAIEYEETPHKQKMRELAKRLMDQISLPWIMDSFIISLKPGRPSLGRDDFPISITQNNKIEVPLSVAREGKLSDPHEALRSHLRTGGFSELLDEIELWRQGVADNLLKCHRLLGVQRRGLERAYKTSIPLDYPYKTSIPIDYQGELGFTIWFPMTICADAVEQARGSSHFRDFPYNYEGSCLRFGAFLVYQGMPNQDLNPYEDVHQKLRTKCAKWERAKYIAKQREELSQTQAQIGRLLQKFIDMERLPGLCELCHQ